MATELERLASEIQALRDEVTHLKETSAFTTGVVSAVDSDTNKVSLVLPDGTETTVDHLALSTYTPVTGQQILAARNGRDVVILDAPGAPLGEAVQVAGVTVTGGVGSLLVEWTSSTTNTVAGNKGYYIVEVDTSADFAAPLYSVNSVGNAAIIGTDLDPATTYYVRVREVDMYNTLGLWSDAVTGSPIQISSTTITDGSVTTPKLAASAVTADKLAVNSVTAGKVSAGSIDASKLAALQLQVGQYVRSAGYSPGSAGWNIDASGAAEFNGVVVRGEVAAANVYASQVTTVEGANLLANPGFETDISGWTTGAIFTRDTGQKHSGTASGLFTLGGVGLSRMLKEDGTLVLLEDGANKILLEGFALENYISSAAIPCTAGATYEARAWYRYGGAATNFNTYAGIEWFDANGVQIGTVVRGSPFYPGLNTWSQVSSGAQTAPSNAVYMSLRASVYNFNAAESAWVDDLMLFRTSSFVGSLQTSASPNLPRVSIVDNDATLGPSVTIIDGRSGAASLGLTSPAGKPTTQLRGAAYDSNVPTMTMTGGDGASGASNILLAADSLHDLTGVIMPVGAQIPWAAPVGIAGALAPPQGWLVEDARAVSRTTYARLFAYLVPLMGTCTISNANPGVITLNAHGLQVGDPVYFTTTGGLPTGLSINTLYYVQSVTTNTFTVSATRVGAAIATSSAGTGTHSLRFCPHGLGDGTTTFNLPDGRGVGMRGADNQGGTQRNLLTSANTPRRNNLGAYVGEETHLLVTAEMPSHSHTMNGPGAADRMTAAAWVSNSTANVVSPSSWSTVTALGDTGGSGAHNNVPPDMIANWIIKY